MQKATITFSILIIFVLLVGNSYAQGLGLRGVGGRLSFVDPEGGGGGTIGFGGHADFGEIIPNLVLVPSLEYWSKSGVSSFLVNGDVRYYIPSTGEVDFFAGGGLGIAFLSRGARDDVDLGLNLLAGADFPVAQNLAATAKIKFFLSDFNVVKITVGMTYFFAR